MAKEPDPTRGSAESQERQDRSFEDGVQESLQQILALYEATDRDLVVAINGSAINVGKSRLEARLRQELMKTRIYTDTVAGDERSASERDRGLSASDLEAMEYKPRRVHFRIQQGLSLRSTQQYREFLSQNPDLVVPDFIIAIYRPDKPFQTAGGLVPVGDIVIRNELATDKPR